jgi:hypothetical protein
MFWWTPMRSNAMPACGYLEPPGFLSEARTSRLLVFPVGSRTGAVLRRLGLSVAPLSTGSASLSEP